MKHGHEPFVRVVKRTNISKQKVILYRVAALLGALLAGALLVAMLGYNPVQMYSDMVSGALGKTLIAVNKKGIVEFSTSSQATLKIVTLLLVTSLGLTMAFKMRFWNIGGEGQILVGAISCSYIAVHYGNTWPHWLLLVVMFIAACIGGGLYGLLPAIFKAKWGTNETLFTLMLNYIAINFITYLQYLPAWQMDGTSFPKIRNFSDATRIPEVLGVHAGWMIALVLAVLVYFYFAKTKQGYEITVVGESANTAKYAGMSVTRIILRTMFVSGAICGFAGFLQVSGASGTLSTDTANGAGFTAITVAWLSGMNPLLMVLYSCFIAILQRGSNRIQTTMGIPKSAADMLIGIILFFMLGVEFFINYQLIFRARHAKEEAAAV
ncbi:MAG: ABC transporter permease [Eubacteriales bacterium]|nr:ABC transporter permease [Eubacteriales bacterium]